MTAPQTQEAQTVQERLRWKAMYQGAVVAQRMVRNAIEELFDQRASLESEDATLLRGPEAVHEAEAQIAALQRLADHMTKQPDYAATADLIKMVGDAIDQVLSTPNIPDATGTPLATALTAMIRYRTEHLGYQVMAGYEPIPKAGDLDARIAEL